MTVIRFIPCVALISCLAACASTPAPQNAPMTTAMTTQGKALLAKGKREEARDIYLSALARDKNNARAWNGLGVAYDLMGNQAKARDAYEHALALMPNDMTVANNLAHLYLEEGRADAAIKLLAPHATAKDTPSIVRQNYERAQAMLRAPKPKSAPALKSASAQKKATRHAKKKAMRAPKASPVTSGAYAYLGSFTTEGLAKGHLNRIKPLLKGLSGLSFTVTPDVKKSGGTPVFTIKARTQNPAAVCRCLSPKGLTCTSYKK